MKKLFLLTALLVSYNFTYAQCDRTVTFKCDKARDFKNGVLNTEMPMESTITIDSSKITLTATMNGETETVEGEITEISVCDWKEFLVNGKAQYKALLKKANDQPQESVIDVVSENGNIKISLALASDTSNKIQVDVAEYKITEPADPSTKEEPLKKGKKKKKTTAA
ncbi:hypothetical protein WG954_10635 [Lacibacter sp. H375]|uniref:hypothetical protein n=1 Tax=Lacibacter sp. H375 TaxID=3133424 RepID=UPI0030C4BCF8